MLVNLRIRVKLVDARPLRLVLQEDSFVSLSMIFALFELNYRQNEGLIRLGLEIVLVESKHEVI